MQVRGSFGPDFLEIQILRDVEIRCTRYENTLGPWTGNVGKVVDMTIDVTYGIFAIRTAAPSFRTHRKTIFGQIYISAFKIRTAF